MDVYIVFSITAFIASVICGVCLSMICDAWEINLIEKINYICYRIFRFFRNLI